MRILVTGGAGFIGSNFVRYMLGKYPRLKVANLDKLTYSGNIENLRGLEKNPRYRFIKGDICDAKIVSRAMKGCDAVVNFAAETHVDRSIKYAPEFIRTNVFGTQVLLETAREMKVKRYQQISTDEVYGTIDRGSFTEKSPLKPNSPYSASKAAGDLLARSYYITYGLPVVITRSSNNFGPYQFPEKVIPLFITNALQNRKVPVYADGSNVRDWLYVIDNCEAIDVVLQKGKAGEVYNIGGDHEMKNIDLTRKILKFMDKSDRLIKFVKDRPGHDKRYSLDNKKINSLGWRPRHDFEGALKDTIDWYTENEDWWRRLIKKREEKFW